MKVKKIREMVDINKLYMISEYVNYSKIFFNNLDKFIEKCDTTDEASLVDFYCNVRFEYKKLKEVCLNEK